MSTAGRDRKITQLDCGLVVIAQRIGIVKTMAFSHGAASLIYLFLPFAPSFAVAAGLTIFRSFLAYMDNPLRSSFIMGVVRPEERGSAAGITTLSRHIPVAVTPSLSAYMMQAFSLNVPIVLGGFLQLFHDCTFYYLFHDVKPPEEKPGRAVVRDQGRVSDAPQSAP